MKKPQDPRKHGLQEPLKDIVEEHKIKITNRDSTSYQYSTSAKCSLKDAQDLWDREKVKKSYDGKTIVEGPFIVSEYRVQHLVFKTSMPNPHYQYQLAAYNAEVNAYKEKLDAYETWIENKKKGIKEDMDKNILRLEHKLANLKAARDNQPIPYPDE